MSHADSIDTEALQIMREALGEDFDEIIELFLDQTPRLLGDLRKYLVAEDRQALWQTAHTLKGSSSNVGAARFSSMCYELEHLGKGCQPSATVELITKLEHEYSTVRSALTREIEARPL